MKPFTSPESTTVQRSYGILTLVTPLEHGWGAKRQIVSLVYLVVTIIKLSNETMHATVNHHFCDRGVLYRSKIDDYGAETSHLYHFSACGRGRTD